MREILGKNYYNVAEASELLNVNKDTIRRYINNKKLDAMQYGHAFLIEEEAIKQFLENSKK